MGQPLPRIAKKDVPFRQRRQRRRLVIQHGIFSDCVFLGQRRRFFQPLMNFFAAPVGMNVQRARHRTLQGQVMLPPEPAQHKEGIAHPPRGGEDDMRVGALIEDAPEFAHAFRREDVGMVVFVGIQHPINVEEDDVEQHVREVTPCVKLELLLQPRHVCF
jgi:hypothetical protein